VWPDVDTSLAVRALNSLVHTLHRTVGAGLTRREIILQEGGAYQLNVGSEVGLDVLQFDGLADEGERRDRAGQADRAIASYAEAVEIYHGDLCVQNELPAIMERERLRARYFTLLSRLADHWLGQANYRQALNLAQRLLAGDPCREDAHRVVMRCHVRLGERAQALHQYRLLEQVLRREFDAVPEPTTVELFDRVRLRPELV
jgi:DNA-binding SARP family transcriptional activator